MKLTNPTDDQLNVAFAQKVCNTTVSLNGHMWKPNGEWFNTPCFTQSADVVLPYLYKWANANPELRGVEIYHHISGKWHVILTSRTSPIARWTRVSSVLDDLPMAIALSLLHAHGVEVEFTT